MEISVRTITIVNVFLTILHCLALGLTVFRIHYRHRTRRLWWDDYFAAGAGILDFAGLLVLWMDYAGPGSPLQTIRANMTRYGVGVFTIIATEWATRISLALAFSRIFAPEDPTHIYAIGLAITFAGAFVAVIVRGVIHCSHMSSWLFNTGLVQCNFSRRIIIAMITVNVIADMLLVFSPMYKLRRVKLPPHQRRLILSCLAGSMWMSLACIGTSIFQIAPMSWEPARGFIRVLFAYFESGISLVICNLLVVVTYTYTVLQRRRHESVESPQASEESKPPTTATSPMSSTHVADTRVYSSDVIPINLTEISDAYFTRTGEVVFEQ